MYIAFELRSLREAVPKVQHFVVPVDYDAISRQIDAVFYY